MFLKRSRSRKKIASWHSWRLARAIAWVSVSLKRARLGRPVSVSWVARRWIIDSAEESSSLVRRTRERRSLMRPHTKANDGSTMASVIQW